MSGEQINRREFLKLSVFSGLSWLGPRSFLDFEERSLLPEVVKRIEIEASYFALTIDDGWSPEILRDMLDLLANEGVQADFFLVGIAVENCNRKMPGMLERLVEDGHKIGYHTMYHDEKSLNMSVDELRKDFEQWKQTFRGILGDQLFEKGFSGCARAVGGYFYPAFLSFCASEKLLPCGWSITPTPQTFGKGLRIGKGDIVLYHVRSSDLGCLRWLLGEDDLSLIAANINFLLSIQESHDLTNYNRNKRQSLQGW